MYKICWLDILCGNTAAILGKILRTPAMAIKPGRWQDGCRNSLVILELVRIKQAKEEKNDVATL